jgi:hypothetical protein
MEKEAKDVWPLKIYTIKYVEKIIKVNKMSNILAFEEKYL